MRRVPLRLGLGLVLREELGKLNTWCMARTKSNIEAFAVFMQGNYGMTPEEIENDKKLREAKKRYDEAARAKFAEQLEAERKQSAMLPFWRRIIAAVRSAKETAKASLSTNAGVIALIRHCTAAHAAAVAIEQGIDVKSVSVTTEKSAVEGRTAVIGYIEAPSANEEEVMMFAEKLERACPAARMHGNIEWRHTRSGSGHWHPHGSYDARTGFTHGLRTQDVDSSPNPGPDGGSTKYYLLHYVAK